MGTLVSLFNTNPPPPIRQPPSWFSPCLESSGRQYAAHPLTQLPPTQCSSPPETVDARCSTFWHWWQVDSFPQTSWHHCPARASLCGVSVPRPAILQHSGSSGRELPRQQSAPEPRPKPDGLSRCCCCWVHWLEWESLPA